MSEAYDRIVVGGGLTGLVAAWRASRDGERTLLLEASPRVGGVIRTERIGPWRVERAAATFPSNAADLLALHGALPAPPPIRTPPAEANRQFLWGRAGLVALPRTPPAFLAAPILSFPAKVRLLSEFLRGPRRVEAPESAHAFVRRRFGAEVADRLLSPMTLGIYGTHPRDLGLADAFPALAKMEREHGGVFRGLSKRKGAAKRTLLLFQDGMDAFPSAIATALGDAVRTSSPVESLTPVARGVEIRTASGVVRARSVVLATTAEAQSRLVAPFAPTAASPLAAVRYVPMVVVAAGWLPGEGPALPTAFGFLRSPGARGRILGASFPSCLDPAVAPEGASLATVFVGGGSDPDALVLSDPEIRATVERDLSRALRAPVRPSFFSIHRWPRAIPVLSPGHRARMADAQRALRPFGVLLCGSHVTGVGVHACCQPLPA